MAHNLPPSQCCTPPSFPTSGHKSTSALHGTLRTRRLVRKPYCWPTFVHRQKVTSRASAPLGKFFVLFLHSLELSSSPSNSYFTPHADGWTITKQDLVLLTETRPMLRISAIDIGADRTCVHLVYHQLVRRSIMPTLQHDGFLPQKLCPPNLYYPSGSPLLHKVITAPTPRILFPLPKTSNCINLGEKPKLDTGLHIQSNHHANQASIE